MKTIKVVLLFAIMLIFSGNSFSQSDNENTEGNKNEVSEKEAEIIDNQWLYLGENKDYKVYINKDSIVESGDTQKYTDFKLKLICKADCFDGFKSVSYSVQHWNIYCETRQFIMLTITDYYTDGETNTYSNKELSEIMEGSPGEKVYNYICKKDK